MKGQLFNKKIPTILGIILVLLGIFLTTIIIGNQTMFKSKASNSEAPLDVKVTNITDISFTITYLTNEPVTGSISYGNDKKLGESELEELDKEKGSFSPRKIHSISIKKLTPSTKYYLTIISGPNTYLNNGIPFEATTGPTISSSSAKSDLVSAKEQTIKGKIVLPDGSIPSEALVYLNAENSQLLSSTVVKDGKFSFPLKDLRTNDLSSYFSADENTIFTIFTTDGSLKSTTLVSLGQSESIPTITNSNNYDFTQEVSPIASKSAQTSFPSIAPSNKNSKLEILSPKENQSFTDQKPQFRGTSLPNGKVEIIIHSDEQITTQVVADSNGNWIYKPPNNLSPGVHTITIKTRDSSGILTTIMRSFTVFAAGSQALGSATPSATPIPTLTPTPTPMIATFNSTATPIPTSIPSPTPTLMREMAKDNLPPTGNSPIALTIAGVAATVTGIILSLLIRIML